MDKSKYIIGSFLFFSIILMLSIFSIIRPKDTFSMSERRYLTKEPKLSLDSLINKSFSEEFDSYARDQFPFRSSFRRLKAKAWYNIFHLKDNNEIYVVDGYAAKLVYPLSMSSLEYAVDKFDWIYDNYLKGKNDNIYFSVVPDKGYFLAKKYHYPSMDYNKMFQYMKDNLAFSKYIDISNCLSIEDYYKTDTHWRQDKIVKVADKIAQEMGIAHLHNDYIKMTANVPFYGVYYGQSALDLPEDELNYLTNKELEQCSVYNYDTKETTTVYDMKKLSGISPYDMFLSGSTSLLSITNKNAKSDKELIIFRDSYGSSLTPLLLQAYKKITLVDLRYISSAYLSKYLEFHQQDVLFLYSTLVLNSSYMLK